MPQSPQPIIEEGFDSQSFGGFSDGGPSPVVPRHRQLSQPVEPAGVYPGATGLKYSQTIVPAKRGVGAGMRVSGRRSSAASRSGTPSVTTGSLAAATEAIDSKLQRIRSDSAPTPVSSSTHKRSSPMIAVEDDDEGSTPGAGNGNDAAKRRSSGGSTVMQSLAISKIREPVEPERAASPQVSAVGANGQVNGTPGTTTTTTTENGGDPNRPPLPPFALRFARQAEMEARRRERMKARFNGAAARAAAAGGSGAVTPMRDLSPARGPSVEPVRRQVSNQSALIDDSSSEEERQRGMEEAEDSGPDSEAADGDESSEDEEEGDLEGAVEGEDDEFEGEFLSVPYPMAPVVSTTTGSDDTSVLSSGISVSHSSAFGSSLHIVHSVRNRHRLSPVSENHHGEHKAGDEGRRPSAVAGGEREAAAGAGGSPVSVRPHHVIRRQNKSYFSISPPERVNPRSITSPQSAAPSSEPSRPEPLSLLDSASRQDSSGATSASRGAASSPTVGTNPSFPSVFAKMPVRRPQLKSALTAMLSAKTSVSDNPFTTLYAAMSGRAESASVTLRVWFPESGGPAAQKPLELKVRKDATVEEAIGFGLWTYWDQGIEPKLDEGLEGDGEEVEQKREVKLSALGWNLKIAEFDGAVDEDFPALDRSRGISKFNFSDYAICEATPTQVEQNRVLESKIVRRPSRMMISKKSRSDTNTSATTAASTLAPLTVGGGITMTGGRTPSDTMMLSALTGAPKSGLIMSTGPPIFLKVRIAAAADMHYSTTVNATSEEYMADVLERVCRRRKIESTKEWALVTGDMRIVIPLDRTVASLAGKSDLVLVKRALLEQLGIKDKRAARSSDPNASIFKRMSEVPTSSAALDFTAAYKRFVVYRKLPMLVGRHERALAIDGDYIHIMPAANRGLLDSVKTSSYHKKSIKYCKQSKKPPMTIVKLVVVRDGGNKTYDFEAEDAKKAAEIVACIKNLKATAVERSGTVKQAGRNPRRTTKQYL
ncbi:hypothetical protein M407DRAFT_177775 [Tulasnella calospora MUT 4182]|uniref:Uncharacterized protein n=1 Tax=Tulasnella calospora MUT 4182 TaxID=1051891 RepID=A0A0C3LIG1_9AGAM|nr:hypothetical protein M407DRAFT_177775 [Tulasnella calospora MUT 4182]